MCRSSPPPSCVEAVYMLKLVYNIPLNAWTRHVPHFVSSAVDGCLSCFLFESPLSAMLLWTCLLGESIRVSGVTHRWILCWCELLRRKEWKFRMFKFGMFKSHKHCQMVFQSVNNLSFYHVTEFPPYQASSNLRSRW